MRGRASWLYGPRAERSEPSPETTSDRASLEDLARSLEAELEEVRARLNDLPE